VVEHVAANGQIVTDSDKSEPEEGSPARGITTEDHISTCDVSLMEAEMPDWRM
jgi:hypothetical protein